VVVAGYFFKGGLTLYMQIFQGAKMSLFSYRYSLAFICIIEHPSFGGGANGGANFSVWGTISPKPHPLEPPLIIGPEMT